jgi:hypothetical protein
MLVVGGRYRFVLRKQTGMGDEIYHWLKDNLGEAHEFERDHWSVQVTAGKWSLDDPSLSPWIVVMLNEESDALRFRMHFSHFEDE